MIDDRMERKWNDSCQGLNRMIDDRVGHKCNDNCQGELTYSEKSIPDCHFVHNISHMGCPETESQVFVVGSQQLTP